MVSSEPVKNLRKLRNVKNYFLMPLNSLMVIKFHILAFNIIVRLCEFFPVGTNVVWNETR
jgi:hypothetical protein